MAQAGNFVHRRFNDGFHFITNTNLQGFHQDQKLNSLPTCLPMAKLDEEKGGGIGSCSSITSTKTTDTKGSTDHDDHDKAWLRLGIGSDRTAGMPVSTENSMSMERSRSSFTTHERLELNLFPAALIRPNPNLNVNQMVKNVSWGPTIGGRSDFLTVVSPPLPRPQAGVWFELKAAEKQGKEPFLPQIPKSYLRIKDGKKMTIRLLIKYLAKRLDLDDESEVEVTCRGQQLHPVLTLQFITNNIWCNRRPITAKDHLMILHYGRRANY